ncbi:MAG: hypothetical protein FWD69_04350 [Polyangiaceae bacterium]|nr:hypothetical protein [Polyangiaceae bacterium]
MIIVFGTRSYGKINACGPSHHTTKFFHVSYLPLIPVESWLVLEKSADGTMRAIRAPLQFKSILAAYMRVWGPIAILLALGSGLSAVSAASGDPIALIVAGILTGVVVLALLAATVFSYAVLGKLSEEEKRKRAVYALHLGYPVDPADMGEARANVRNTLLGTIAERSRGLATMGYRFNMDPVQAWPHVALDPTHADEHLVTAAFTLARLEASLPQAPQKIWMEQLHGQIWDRIVRSNFRSLQAASAGAMNRAA